MPGIGWELNTTVSDSPISTHLLVPSAIWVSAARGSPWEPVHTISVRAGSSPSMSVMSRRAWSGTRSRPSSRASPTLRCIDRPRVATVRPAATAASISCWMRWMWLANAPTITRRPSWRAMTSCRTSPTSFSERDDPGASALVESANSSLTPGLSASAPMRDRAVRRPSTGVRSSLKSLECRITPWGVEKAVMSPPGTEWVTGIASHSNGPARKRSPSRTSRSSARSSRPASASLWRTRPRVNAEP